MSAVSDRQRIMRAEHMAAHWLHLGNLAEGRGEKELAERHYARSQKWLDTANDIIAARGSR